MMKRLPFLLITALLIASCNLKEQKSDFGCDTLSNIDLSFKSNNNLPNAPLVSDLIDFYNGSIVLNSIVCDYELWQRDLNTDAKDAITQMDCSIIKNDTIRLAAQRYKNQVLSILFNDSLKTDTTTFDRIADEYSTFKGILIDRYNVNNFGELSEETYWKIYDKSNLISNYDSIQSLDKTDSLSTLYLKELIKKETDFDKKCIYTLEYAHSEETYSIIKSLENLMRSDQYSIYLYETWRYWRCLLQDNEYGSSKDSYIPNNIYNQMRMICANTILNYIIEHPNDIMAINQFIILSGTDNIYRYGIFPYGNQNFLEKVDLFPERYESLEENRIYGCGNTDTISHGFEWADFSKQGYMFINIKYKQQVNGYDVSAICLVDTIYEDYEQFYHSCCAFIHFQNDKHDFIVENPLFSDNSLRQNEQPLKNGILIEAGYIPFKPFNNTRNNLLYSDSECPFFFFDIDFDGKKELIIELREGMGYHGHSAYKAYKIPTTKDCIVFSPMQGEPFDNLNDYTEIDTIGKTITLPYGFGVHFGGRKKYGLVTHLFFNESTYSLEKRQVMELTGIEHYDWEHTRGMKYETCDPNIYHYKKVNGDMKLVNIEKCANDK